MDFSVAVLIRFLLKVPESIKFYKRRKEHNFIYKRFIKKLAVYPEGHGIVINTLEIKSLKDNSVKRIKRGFDISDGCKDIKLPPFEEMLNANEKRRFSNFGFWYKSDVDCKLSILVDEKTKKEFAFEFPKFLKKDETATLTFAFSIKCMFPINENGIYIPEKAVNMDGYNDRNVEFLVTHPIEYFEYEFAFRGIKPKKYPILKVCLGDDDNVIETVEPELFFDPFYERYRFVLKNPKVGVKIKISWAWYSNS